MTQMRKQTSGQTILTSWKNITKSKDGIKPDPEKVQDVADWAEPSNDLIQIKPKSEAS